MRNDLEVTLRTRSDAFLNHAYSFIEVVIAEVAVTVMQERRNEVYAALE